MPESMCEARDSIAGNTASSIAIRHVESAVVEQIFISHHSFSLRGHPQSPTGLAMAALAQMQRHWP